MSEEKEVWLYQYDLTNGIGPSICKFMTGIEIEGVWHTSLVVFGREYFFGGGIQSGIPELTPYGKPIKKSLFGKTTKTKNRELQSLQKHGGSKPFQLFSILGCQWCW